jgi:hypothetical protein
MKAEQKGHRNENSMEREICDEPDKERLARYWNT